MAIRDIKDIEERVEQISAELAEVKRYLVTHRLTAVDRD